jgi:DHA2 family methylenomycin A resistance protein-like MFS transporter
MRTTQKIIRVSTKQYEHMSVSLVAVCLGFFMVMIDVTVVNVAMPSMAANLHGGISELQWVVDGYTLTFACLLLSAGNLGDHIGAKAIFIWGLSAFVLASFGCGVASTLWMLTAFRLLQGIAAALVVPTSLALINSTYTNRKERAKAIGVWGGIAGIAAASGPILGAMLTAWLGWRAVFFINIPIGLIGILLTARYVKKTVSERKGSFDLPGQVMGIVSIASLAFALIEAGKLGWFSGMISAALCVFLVTFILFLVIEHRTTSPLLPLDFFKTPTFSASIAVGIILNIGFYGGLFILPLYFHQIRGYSIFETGLAILPLPGLAALASYLGGKMASVTGPKPPMILGLAIGGLGFFTMLIAGMQTPPYFVLILPLMAIGFGTAFTMPAATIAVINSAPDGRAGLASGALNTGRQVGSLIGVAIFGTVINTSANFISGMHSVLIIGGVTFLFGCVITWVFINREGVKVIFPNTNTSIKLS